MNLARLLTGCLRALSGRADWPSFFDLSRRGFQHSFAALLLSLPCYYLAGLSIQKQTAITLGRDVEFSAGPFILIFAIYALMFSITAYVLAMMFDRIGQYRPWVIVRHWSVFFAAFLAAGICGLFLSGLIPFSIVYSALMVIYLSTLLIDIRLAQKVAEFDLGWAVLIACVITVASLMILLIGVSYFA